MHVVSRAPSFVLLGLVLVAAALLIAGYGAPVGIGVVAGLLLGGAVVLAILGMNPQTHGGASYSWLDSTNAPNQPDHDAIQHFHAESLRVIGVDAGDLRRVIPVSATVDGNRARLELIAIEIREDGGIAGLVAHTRPPVGMPGHFVTLSVTDDAGTSYAASGQGSGGSNAGTMRYEIRFAPAPPPNARQLTIRVESFASPFPAPASRLEGPWEFRVDL